MSEKTSRFIPELNRALSFELLAIWDGTSTRKTPEECEWYRQEWIRQAKEPKVLPTAVAPAPTTIRTDCINLGQDTSQTVNCPTCCGNVKLKLFGCSVHGTCTLGKRIPNHGCCDEQCTSYQVAKPLKPWDYPVSVVIPHLNTPEPLGLAIDLWRLQSVRPYFLIIDTGSGPANLQRVQALRSADCEVHCMQKYEQRHPSCNVAAALDLAHGLCRTTHLFHTHTDVFPRKRDFLAWLIRLTSPSFPVVGWRMSERQAGPWKECVSHTATMIHNPTFRLRRLSWSLDAYLDAKPDEAILRSGWPDTESGLWYSMMREGLRPKFLGDDENHARAKNEWFDHSRSYTCITKNLPPDHELCKRAVADMEDATKEARERLEIWGARHDI